YVGRGAMDDNGVGSERVPFEVSVEIAGGDVVVDFTNVPDEQPGPVNCPLATTVSAARIAIMTFASGDRSANEGYFRPIEVRTRPGPMFPPRPPAPIFLYFWPAMQAVDVLHRALADAMPDAVPAGNGGDLGSLLFWGRDEDGAMWGDGWDHL